MMKESKFQLALSTLSYVPPSLVAYPTVVYTPQLVYYIALRICLACKYFDRYVISLLSCP